MDDYDPNEKTYACKVCGRRFVRSSLEKHEPACKKLQKLNRKVFDSGKQRAVGSDVPIAAVRKAQKEKEKHGGVFPRPKTHWREKHEEFIGAVSGARHVDRALKTGGPLPPPPKTSYNPDYIKCDYCGRSFNQNAAERHIQFCREQHAKTGQRAAPKTSGGGNKPRSNSQPRNPPSRSPSQSRSGSRRPSTKANNISPVSSGYGRAPATGASTKGRPVANSAGVRTSHLPTPVKRSNSAPRTAHAQPKTPGTGYSQHGSSGPRKSIPTSNGRDERRAPSTGKASTSTSSTTSGRRPSQTRSKRQ